MFKLIFDGAIQAGQLAEKAAGYLHGYIPGEWNVRKLADPELFEGITEEEYERQDPKIVREDSPVALDLTSNFIQATFLNLQTLASGKLTLNQEPTTVVDPALSTLNNAKQHLDAKIPEGAPDKPNIPKVERPVVEMPKMPPSPSEG
ncbi:hypothetical protein ACETRX_35325 [Labrys portucalensis]|uniref:Uncharacterized protein n=1 Tax=Labrys neptuniae TaxID=376174 RepID=A0ABV6ZRU3_9HYPH